VTIEMRLAEGLEALGIALGEGDRTRLVAFVRLVEKWNKVHNLTAVRDPARMVALHLLDSLSLLPHLGDARTLLDVGTGAGLPGIPLAIARPHLAVSLLDSSQKKATFLRQAKAELALANTEITCERVEHWHPDRKFDVIVSRAFADLADFVNQSRHLLAEDGVMLAMKGVHPHEEIARLPSALRLQGVVELHVPQLDAQRHLVFLKAA
jgi:16S rRNA (guanine527-N7)-methyltransferase